MTTPIKPASHSNILSICRFCLNNVDATPESHWLQWDDSKISTLTHNYELITNNKLSISSKVSQLCCSECATLINQSAEAVQMCLNAEYFWTSYLDSSEPTSQPYDNPFKAEELLYDDGSTEILDSSIKEELEDFHYVEQKYRNSEMTVELSITPATHKIRNDECDEVKYQDKSSVSFCDFCDEGFSTEHNLRMHVHNKHAGPSDYGVEEYTITTDLKQSPSNNKVQCEICNKLCANVKEHTRRVHGPNYNLQCSECGKMFKNYPKLNFHMKRHRTEQYECDICRRKFTMRCYIVAHMQKHIQSMRYKCEIGCGKFFRTSPVYHRHQKICQGKANPMKQENSVQCVFCSRGYVTMTGLFVHYQNNHEASDYETICMECNRMCSDVGELATHKASAHPKLECPICKQILRTKETLTIHISNHSQKNRPFSCEICKATFNRGAHLKAHHRRMHTQYRPFKCTECAQRFAQRYELTAHIKHVHISKADRPYGCDLCDSRFVSPSALITHSFMHTGGGKYKCEKCDEVFRSTFTLQVHHAAAHPV